MKPWTLSSAPHMLLCKEKRLSVMIAQVYNLRKKRRKDQKFQVILSNIKIWDLPGVQWGSVSKTESYENKGCAHKMKDLGTEEGLSWCRLQWLETENSTVNWHNRQYMETFCEGLWFFFEKGLKSQLKAELSAKIMYLSTMLYGVWVSSSTSTLES